MEGQNVTQRGSLAKRERQTSMQKGRRTATASSTHCLHCCCFSPRQRSLSWIALAIIYLPFKWKMEPMPTHGKHTGVHKDRKKRDGRDYRQITWRDFIALQLSELPSMSGGGEPKGWAVTRIRAHSEEQEGQEGHKRRRTSRSKGEFLDGSGFEEGKLWATDYMLTL